jgi:hypothetical protein
MDLGFKDVRKPEKAKRPEKAKKARKGQKDLRQSGPRRTRICAPPPGKGFVSPPPTPHPTPMPLLAHN